MTGTGEVNDRRLLDAIPYGSVIVLHYYRQRGQHARTVIHGIVPDWAQSMSVRSTIFSRVDRRNLLLSRGLSGSVLGPLQLLTSHMGNSTTLKKKKKLKDF